MKFMQRAAASSAASSPGTDTETHSSKKRKLGHEAAAQNRFNAEIDQASIQAAIEEREAKRQAALEKHALAADTHWTLPTPRSKDTAGASRKQALRVVYVGYGGVDSSDEGEEDDPQLGRTSTKKDEPSESKAGPHAFARHFNQTLMDSQDSLKRKRPDSEEPGQDTSDEGSSNSDEDGDDDRIQDDDGQAFAAIKSRSRSQSSRNSKRASENAVAKEFRDKRKTKEVKLSKLTSISSSGNNTTPNTKAMKCYSCNQVGHRAAECPSRGSAKRSTRG